jgi:putative spermidine/putrescine transport system permease protein
MPRVKAFRPARALAWAALLLASLGPVAIFVLYGLSRRWFYPDLWPDEWTFSPLWRQLTDPRTRAALAQSGLLALLVSGLSLLVGYPAARAIELGLGRGKHLIYALLFLPTVVPSVATGIGLNIVFLRLGLAGTFWGVALVHLIPVLPYTVLTLGGVFARYDPVYEQQARVLGASRWQTFHRVTLRLIFPGLIVAGLLATLISWSQYVLTLLIGGGRVVTLPILLFSTLAGGNPTTTSGLALIFIAPLVLVLALSARYLAAAGPNKDILPQ